MNVIGVQDDFGAVKPTFHDGRSLDKIFLSEAQSRRAAGDEVHILPENDWVSILPVNDDVSTTPITDKEQKLVELYNAILRGDTKTTREILTLAKTIGSSDGERYFKKIEDQLLAVAYVLGRINKEDRSHATQPALSAAFTRLLNMQDFNAQTIDSIVNPTVWNGGKSPFAEDE